MGADLHVPMVFSMWVLVTATAGPAFDQRIAPIRYAMCSGSDEGSYSRLIDFMYHSNLGWRVIKKKRSTGTCRWCFRCGCS